MHSNSTYYLLSSTTIDSIYYSYRSLLVCRRIYWIREYAHKALEESAWNLTLGPMTRWIARVFRERCELCGHVMTHHNIRPNGLGECNICRRISGQCQLEPYRHLQTAEVNKLGSKDRLLTQFDKHLKLRKIRF
jgi:hypothetical protein